MVLEGLTRVSHLCSPLVNLPRRGGINVACSIATGNEHWGKGIDCRVSYLASQGPVDTTIDRHDISRVQKNDQNIPLPKNACTSKCRPEFRLSPGLGPALAPWTAVAIIARGG